MGKKMPTSTIEVISNLISDKKGYELIKVEVPKELARHYNRTLNNIKKNYPIIGFLPKFRNEIYLESLSKYNIDLDECFCSNCLTTEKVCNSILSVYSKELAYSINYLSQQEQINNTYEVTTVLENLRQKYKKLQELSLNK